MINIVAAEQLRNGKLPSTVTLFNDLVSTMAASSKNVIVITEMNDFLILPSLNLH